MGNSEENIHSASEWYCCVAGKVWGPLSTEGLHNLARRGRLSPEDQVKNGVNGNWIVAESIDELFSQDDASKSAENLLLASARDNPWARQTGASRKRTAAYRSPVRAIRGVLDFVFIMLSVILNVGLSLVRRVRGFKYAFAAVAVIAVAWFGWRFVSGSLPTSTDLVLADFQELYGRLSRSEIEKDEKALLQLDGDISKSVAKWEDRLSREASFQRPDLIELHAAARLFPIVFHEVRNGANEPQSLRKLSIHLANAEDRIDRLKELQRESALSQSSIFNNSVLFKGVIVVDIALLGWLLVYLTRLLKREAA